MPNAAEKVKDSQTKMGPLNLVIKRFLVVSAKSSFYKTKESRFSRSHKTGESDN